MTIRKKGMLLVISGPSGVGKGTIFNKVLEEDKSFTFSTSVTTRTPRPGEIDGVHYFFITDEEYDRLIAEDAFVEHAQVHNHRYGTLRSQIDSALEKGLNVVLDIDPQGAINVMKKCPDCVSVFILPPDMETLRMRLTGRGTETEDEIERRLGNARGEIAQADKYDYAIINDKLDEACEQLKAIISAEKLRTIRFMPDIQ